MKERIEIKSDYYSIEDCLANMNKVYVFGDNLIDKGRGGQAIIRYCPNSFGIPTKRLPTMDNDAFFSDTPDEIKIVQDKLIKLLDIYNKGKYIIVLPKDGIGTGLARLNETSPKIYNLIKNFFIEHFDAHIM